MTSVRDRFFKTSKTATLDSSLQFEEGLEKTVNWYLKMKSGSTMLFQVPMKIL